MYKFAPSNERENEGHKKVWSWEVYCRSVYPDNALHMASRGHILYYLAYYILFHARLCTTGWIVVPEDSIHLSLGCILDANGMC